MAVAMIRDQPAITEYAMATIISWAKASTQKYSANSKIFVCPCFSGAGRLARSVAPTAETTSIAIPVNATVIQGPGFIDIWQTSGTVYLNAGGLA